MASIERRVRQEVDERILSPLRSVTLGSATWPDQQRRADRSMLHDRPMN
jgi:hypothetical protein